MQTCCCIVNIGMEPIVCWSSAVWKRHIQVVSILKWATAQLTPPFDVSVRLLDAEYFRQLPIFFFFRCWKEMHEISPLCSQYSCSCTPNIYYLKCVQRIQVLKQFLVCACFSHKKWQCTCSFVGVSPSKNYLNRFRWLVFSTTWINKELEILVLGGRIWPFILALLSEPYEVFTSIVGKIYICASLCHYYQPVDT